MSKIQDVPFITKVIDTLSDELKSGLYDLIDGQVKTPVFRSLVNNDYAITEANDKGKVQFVTLETLRGNYTGYLAYNSVYCVLIAFKGNTQALDMLNINVAKHTFAFVNESLSILELRVELEDGKEGVTPTDLGVTNNNIHLAKGTTQIGEGINLKTLDGNTLIGSGNVGFKTINDQEIVGDGNIVVGEGGTIAIDTAFDETSTNPVQNKVVTGEFNKYKSLLENYAVNIQFKNTSDNILALTSDNGTGLGTDTGHWYYWNGTQYADGGVYQTSVNYDDIEDSVFYINNKLTNPLVDILPHIPVCYKQGGIDNTASTRISTPNYIKVDGYKRLYVEYTGTALAEMYIDTYTGTEGNYVHFLGYGYYSANNEINISAYNITAIKITFRKPNNGDITPSEIEELTKNVVAYLVDAKGEDSVLPIKLRIMQYNIGKFNYGERGGLSSNVETKILNYKKFLAQYRPDICCLEEYPMSDYTGYIPTIDSDGEYYPDEVIFDNSYYYKTQGFFGDETKTNIPYKSATTFSIDEEDTTYRTKGILTVYTLHGKSVGIINGWFNVSAPVENRLAQLNDCIARLQNYDIGIICVDSNVASQTELDNLTSVAKAAGYVCANGDYFGYIDTYNPSSSMFKCIDQIWVKGAKIVNVECPDVYNDLSSDHLPLIADIIANS